jgi:hypothetical protein
MSSAFSENSQSINRSYATMQPMAATTSTRVSARIVRHEDGLALVFDAETARELGLDENLPVEVTVDKGAIHVSPAARHPAPDELDAALDRVNRKWGDVLKKLAE